MKHGSIFVKKTRRHCRVSELTHSNWFSEAAELRLVLRLDVRATIRARMLQPWTVYAACLVFKIAAEAAGLQSAKAIIRFVNDESDRDAAKRAQLVHLQLVKDAKGDDGEVEARVLEFRRWKTGLVVQGVVNLIRLLQDFLLLLICL
ncbi:hypothetical protein Salat_1724200 [Sesamum alatum]|uniref:Uncharacterized protein n=1 Tax=Sesamum alatum TaxID=300844 RepID=A0AAE1Y7U1_9LAMI|nr:hypothetical protein Salat_1724200 [Sesamum alatum]